MIGAPCCDAKISNGLRDTDLPRDRDNLNPRGRRPVLGDRERKKARGLRKPHADAYHTVTHSHHRHRRLLQRKGLCRSARFRAGQPPKLETDTPLHPILLGGTAGSIPSVLSTSGRRTLRGKLAALPVHPSYRGRGRKACLRSYR
jgi:hypothetical protein